MVGSMSAPPLKTESCRRKPAHCAALMAHSKAPRSRVASRRQFSLRFSAYREANQFSAPAAGANKQPAAGKCGQGARGFGRDAGSGELVILGGVGACKDEVPVGFLDEEFVVGEYDVSDAEAGSFPL